MASQRQKRYVPISHRDSTSSAWLRQNVLLLLTIGAVFTGVTVGLVLRHLDLSARTIRLIGFPGELLMRMLQCVILPLIVASLITGLAQLNIKDSGRIGGLAIAYYMVTTLIAIATGVVLVTTIRPGHPEEQKGLSISGGSGLKSEVDTLDTLLDLIRNMFPNNLFSATMQQTQTVYKCEFGDKSAVGRKQCEELFNRTVRRSGRNVDLEEFIKSGLQSGGGMNILGVIVCSITFGIILSQMGEKGRTMVDFFAILDYISMRVVGLIMWYSPIGIMSLILNKILGVKSVAELFQSLGLYVGTVLAGFSVHLLFTLPLLYFVFTRKNPLKFASGMLQALTVAFGTASSAATLPMTFRCLEQNLGVDRRVTRFVLPVGAIINMDGTALYEAVSAIFIAQVTGMELSVGKVIVISLSATLASIGAASVPSGGLITLVMVLNSVGIDPKYVSLVVAVDWFIDRFRTAINVLGDSIGAAIIFHLCGKHLSDGSVQKNGHIVGHEMNGKMQNREEQRRPLVVTSYELNKSRPLP